MCSAPQNSGTSVMSTVPPDRTSRSAARPRAGLAESPEKPSEPPHFTPMINSFIDAVLRRASLICGSIAATSLRPRSMTACVPPVSWMP